MTINFYDAGNANGLFDIQGKAFYAQSVINTARGSTIPTEINDVLEIVNNASIDDDLEAVAAGLGPQINASKSVASGQLSALRTFAQNWLIEVVEDDNPQKDRNLATALQELISQMESNSEWVEANAVAVSVAAGSSNTGDGVVITSTKRGDGLINENMLAEDLIARASTNGPTAAIAVSGEAKVEKLAADWPQGSGASTAISAVGAESSLLANGDMEAEDDNDNAPDDWIFPVATIGTTVKMTNVEVQVTTVTGTPTSGFYYWSISHKGVTKTTKALAYNAPSSSLQTAIRELPGFSQVTVAESGTTPNLVHTITFTGVGGNLNQHTIIEHTDSGTYTPSTDSAGTAQVLKGGKALEIDSDGAELTTMQQRVILESLTAYAFSGWAICDSVPAGGVFTIDLVDGTAGTVINDAQGIPNSVTFDASDLTTSWQHFDDLVAGELVFRMPLVVPDIVYFRIRTSTAVSNTTSVFLDHIALTKMTSLYSGGPLVAIFSGATDFKVNDTWTITVTNDRAGLIQTYYDRNMDMREKGLLLPSSASITIPDSVIG